MNRTLRKLLFRLRWGLYALLTGVPAIVVLGVLAANCLLALAAAAGFLALLQLSILDLAVLLASIGLAVVCGAAVLNMYVMLSVTDGSLPPRWLRIPSCILNAPLLIAAGVLVWGGFYLPAALPAAAGLGGLAAVFATTFRLPPLGCCHVCRYDLTGNVSGVCPECGTPVSDRPVMVSTWSGTVVVPRVGAAGGAEAARDRADDGPAGRAPADG